MRFEAKMAEESPAPEIAGRPAPDAVERPHRDLRISLLILLLCLLVYNANRRVIATGDTYPARYLPFAIWHNHTLLLDSIATMTAQGWKVGAPPGQKRPADEWRFKAYWIMRGRDGHLLSLYPVVVPLFVTPLYLPAVVYLHAAGWEDWRLDWIARIMEKLSASLVAAISAALLYLLLRRRASPRVALLLTLAYAFGTTTWMISSQALWQHGMAELLIVAMLFAITGPCTVRAAIAAGLICGLIACNRPPDSIFAAALGLYGLWWAGRKIPWLVAAAMLPLVLLLLYNFGVAGHFAGGYGLAAKPGFFGHNPLTGFAGLLFSPVRGLFVFSPFLLFLVCYPLRGFRDRNARGLTAAICVAVALQLAVYARTDWRQGTVWGPRWLTDMLPLLIWMLPPVFEALHRSGRTVFVSACIVAVAIEGVGAFWYTGASDAAIYGVPVVEDAMHAAWDVRNTPFLVELRHPRAPAELTTQVRGSLDRVKAGAGEDLASASGKEIDVEGWALSDARTPREVQVMLDGQVVASTTTFFPRPDVVKALGLPSPAGWRTVIGRHRLIEGEHLLSVLVRALDDGTVFFLAARRFNVSAPPPLQIDPRIQVRGSIDIARTKDGQDLSAANGQAIDVEGWSLIADRTPQELLVTIDGQVVSSTSAFFERPDVVKAIGVSNPSGWRTTIDPNQLPAGPHVLSVGARTVEGGPAGMLAERRFTVPGAEPAGDLRYSAGKAEAALARAQQAPGYWLTSFTSSPRFEHPRPEMNTYLTAMMIDVLDPVATEASLDDSLQRARRFLSTQIEADGLVRYHGLPGAPTIGTLGCLITPDADDTALAWRIAPIADRSRLREALATLRQYRTASGLYRTWLAPRDHYRCIDPGKDPDPADAGIQMHIFMLLAQAAPPAAQALCSALRQNIADDRIWVYYKRAPIVPILRESDVQRAGCALELPPARVQTTVPGQEQWISTVRMLQRLSDGRGPLPSSSTVRDLLRAISRDEFAALRQSPPLFYHNDLTASVPRFYWSQEFGYALWLRLYFANVRREHAAGGTQ